MQTADKQHTSDLISRTLENAQAAIVRNIPRIGDKAPALGTKDYSWDYCGPSNWVSGFWAGQLWLCYYATQNVEFLSAARRQKAYHEHLLAHPEWHDHDLGFQYILTCVADYKLTSDASAFKMAYAAAQSLASRFREKGGYLVAWNEDHELGPERTRGKAIIDSLQNLSLLFWAANETGEDRLREIAVIHADTLLEHIIPRRLQHLSHV